MRQEYRSVLLPLLTIVLWGAWGFFGKLALDHKMAPLAIFFAEIFVSLVCALVFMSMFLTKGDSFALFSSWNIYGLISGAGLAVGLLLYYLALEKGQLSVIVPVTATYPLVAVLLGYGILGERPSASQWVGILLVVIGIALLLPGPLGKAPAP